MSKWHTEYSEGVDASPIVHGCVFSFPKAPGHLNMLSREVKNLPVVFGHNVVATFKVEGYTQFKSCDRANTFKPSVRLHFQRKDDDWQREDGRWWSNPSFKELAVGQFVLQSPLRPGRWSNVNGKMGNYDDEHRTMFREALDNVGKVGLSFGADFFAHGIYVEGTPSRFTLENYEVV